jgi:SAM-dependent methyltransferase
MNEKRSLPKLLYTRKILNTFLPKILFKLSPNRYWAQGHWKNQNQGDRHGYDKYTSYNPREPVIMEEIRSRLQEHNTILDLGCNCGYYLARLHGVGFRNLSGIDISPAAIQYGREHFHLEGVDLITGSFEDELPKLVSAGKKFDLVYTLGATVELVHPSFDIIGNMCRLSEKYIVLIISEWGHSYPRFWEYEFFRNGFYMVKCIRPYDGELSGRDFTECDSLLVFERM